eukprot:Gb_35911 [translate_table: standard]
MKLDVSGCAVCGKDETETFGLDYARRWWKNILPSFESVLGRELSIAAILIGIREKWEVFPTSVNQNAMDSCLFCQAGKDRGSGWTSWSRGRGGRIAIVTPIQVYGRHLVGRQHEGGTQAPQKEDPVQGWGTTSIVTEHQAS